MIVVNSDSPYRTLNDYIAAARAKPGELAFAAVGPATTQHIGFEQFKRLANINVTYVPYTGGAPAITALLGGHVSAVLANYSEAVEQLNAGKLRALVSLSRERIAPLPDVPSTTEAAMQAPDIRQKLNNLGLYPVGTCLDDFAAHIRRQFDDYGRIIREANIKAE